MDWIAELAYFFAGVFGANGVPHFVNGISGRPFQSPFAQPPGVGESPPIVNVIWGTINFVIGYGLLRGVGAFSFSDTAAMGAVALGALLAAIGLAWHFGRVRAGKN